MPFQRDRCCTGLGDYVHRSGRHGDHPTEIPDFCLAGPGIADVRSGLGMVERFLSRFRPGLSRAAAVVGGLSGPQFDRTADFNVEITMKHLLMSEKIRRTQETRARFQQNMSSFSQQTQERLRQGWFHRCEAWNDYQSKRTA